MSALEGGNMEWKEVDLSKQREYIEEELLMEDDRENQFRIGLHGLPSYIKMEVWNSYLFYDKKLAIQSKDLFFSSKGLADQILFKLIEAVQGSIFIFIKKHRRSKKS